MTTGGQGSRDLSLGSPTARAGRSDTAVDDRGGLTRRAFLAGVLATGTLSAAATYFAPGGRPNSRVEIRFVTGDDPTGARDLLIGMWNRANPDTQIKPDVIKGSTEDQRNEMLSRAKAKSADIFNLDVINIPLFSAMNYIQPLTLPPVSFLDSTLVPCRLGSVSSNAPTWAVPFNADAGLLFVRGPRPPGTQLPAVPSLSQVVDSTVPSKTGQFAGQLISSSSATAEAFAVNILEHALSREEEILDKVGRPADKLEIWQQALTPLRDAIAARRITRCDGEDDSRSRFSSDQLLYMRNWPTEYRLLQQNGDSGALSGELQVGPLRAGARLVGVLGGQSLAISASTSNVDRCQAFINFLAADTSQRVLAAYGLAPTTPAAYNDVSLQAVIPHLVNIRSAVENARPRPIHPNYAAFSGVLVANAREFFDGGRPLSTGFINSLLESLK